MGSEINGFGFDRMLFLYCGRLGTQSSFLCIFAAAQRTGVFYLRAGYTRGLQWPPQIMRGSISGPWMGMVGQESTPPPLCYPPSVSHNHLPRVFLFVWPAPFDVQYMRIPDP